ncbi:MAG: Hsp20/alpha crystallin family protein [Candidatus Promineifilaceae bacterium]
MSTIVRWRPVTRRPMSVFNEFDRMFNDLQGELPAVMGLPLDVVETTDNYMVKASIPGLNPEEVEIIFDDNALTIKGEFKAEAQEEGTKYHLRERRSGSFSRSIKFPVQIESDAIEANYENGVLTLTLPKAEAVKPKKITVKVSK